MQKRKKTNFENLIKPIIYLDSCIIRNALNSRNKEDVTFLEELRKRKYECKTSIYTLLELFEASKDRQYLIKLVANKYAEVNEFLRKRTERDLNYEELDDISEQINSLFLKYEFIEICNISGDEDWGLVKSICETSNIHISDIIHLTTAFINNCTHLVTRDDFLIKEGNKMLEDNDVSKANFIICKPEDIMKLFPE